MMNLLYYRLNRPPAFRTPLILLCLAIISCFLILIHQFYYTESARSYNHNSRLTRGNPAQDGQNSVASHGKYHASDPLLSPDQSARIDDMSARIDDLKRIKLSISNELRLIQREKAKLAREKSSLSSKNDRLLAQISKNKAQLKQLALDISANRKRKFDQNCDNGRIPPIIFNPLKSANLSEFLLPNEMIGKQHYDLIDENIKEQVVRVDSKQSKYAFDLSLCPLTKEFTFHLIDHSLQQNIDDHSIESNYKLKIESNILVDNLRDHRQYTPNISEACLVIILTDSSSTNFKLNHTSNNLIINLASNSYMNEENAKRAAIASPMFHTDSFRSKLDIVLPSIWQPPINYNSIIGSMPAQSPINRKYLASYFGQGNAEANAFSSPSSDIDVPEITASQVNPLEKTLQVIHRNSIDDLFLFIYNCGPNSNLRCYEEREKMIELSTFLIILPQPMADEEIDINTSDQLYLALLRGAIPVILGGDRLRLPFNEVIDWRRAAILLDLARLPEIHFILRTIDAPDLYKMKYFGRKLFENYLATAKQILETTVSVMSLERFNHPPPPIQDVKAITYYSNKNSNENLLIDFNCTSTACLESKSDTTTNLLAAEIFGPRERPFASPSYRRNFSLILNSAYDLWNHPMMSPMHLFPSQPQEPIPPSEYKFLTMNQGYRPIGDGLGGSGVEFSHSLGGDYPDEQFTIVLLTYERKSLLLKTLERLKGLAYLNKILVVWNGVNQKPPADMLWPDVGVPILVVKVDRNSLNNRFLPFDMIETDAVLSLDDDSPLRPDEIVFAFRVWRQSRDRIVGFPGRYHAWDVNQNSWLYNSNHSCELSMVLTGGAFFHKYYNYVYTYSMPEAIRSIVDKFMNCEDIAMNFLVAHLTRKPPIKVTSRWTFHCTNCQSSLSEEESHFQERHECLNTFASIYGYMPLLSTQHRSDSVLFKTRLPHDKQKCFRFV